MTIEQLLVEDELQTLKARATLMGIKYHPSIGLDALKEKLTAAQQDTPPTAPQLTVVATPGAETKQQYMLRKQNEANKLIRCQVTCMNPGKKEYPGVLISVGNNLVGTVAKFVQFEVPWHIPQIVLTEMQSRQYQSFYTVKDERGNKIRKGRLVKEYAIAILDDLTESEIKDLAQRQAMAAGTAA